MPRATPRFVGEAIDQAVVGGVGVRQVIDAVCYAITGVTFLVLAAQPEGGGWGIALGLVSLAYGAKIAFIGGSYWVSYWIYFITAGALFALFGGFSSSG